jgi:hypothetical protein
MPNQELAREIAETEDREAVRELVENLGHKNKKTSSDCIKVLYEVGYLRADLIADCADEFIDLLGSKNNRLVWGSMIALSTMADLRAAELFARLNEIKAAIEEGSVITVDAGVKVLAGMASVGEDYRQEIMPYLLEHLRTCRPKEIPAHGESIALGLDADFQAEFIEILENRMGELNKSAQGRVRKVLRGLE